MAADNERLRDLRGTLIPRTWQYDPALYAPPRYRRACAYEAFLPEGLGRIPPLEPSVAGTISSAETAIRELNSVVLPALAPLARLLLRTESIASSKVEGMQVDARALARAEARTDMGRSVGREAAEILANVGAMQLAVEEAAAEATLTVEHLVAIQSALLENSSSPAAFGRVRDKQNWIGGNDYNPCGAVFVPPPPEEVSDLLADLVEFCADESMSPLAQAAVAHAQFETIHPFDDGNGRTGRALVQVLLRRRGLAPSYVPPISVVLAADKARYIAGLTAFREGREDDWLESFAVAAARAASLASGYLERVRALQNEWRERLRPVVRRSDAAAWLIVDELPAHPVISAPIATAATGRTRPAVNQALAQLAEVGVLTPLGDGRRNRLWEAQGLLDVLAGLEAAIPPRAP